ncbi:hypothetical protein SDC9_183897 [bioreactor metagenome]|uniref:Uncharacterized protein n=1 Tax=bioreactor metagenome TaxID=1076179 RepID=A0A645HBI0_9ZZZZ
MHDQPAPRHIVGRAFRQADAAQLHVDAGDAIAIGAQAGQVAAVVHVGAVLAVRRAAGVEVPARTVAVAAGAITFFVNVKAVL